MRKEKIEIKGLKISFIAMGEGRASLPCRQVLILHGWGSKKEKWQFLGKILAEKGIESIIPDLPGFGESEKPKTIWSLDDYCDFVVDFVKELGLEKFYLLGHSFGGAIATKCDWRFPEKIGKLFLVGAACFRRRTFKARLFYIVSKFLKIFSFLPHYSYLRKGVYRFIIRKTDYHLAKGIMREIYLQLVNKDYPSEAVLSQIKDPTIIVWGERDKITPLKDARLINKRIKDSVLEILPKTGHNVHLDCPEKLAEIIIKYL